MGSGAGGFGGAVMGMVQTAQRNLKFALFNLHFPATAGGYSPRQIISSAMRE